MAKTKRASDEDDDDDDDGGAEERRWKQRMNRKKRSRVFYLAIIGGSLVACFFLCCGGMMLFTKFVKPKTPTQETIVDASTLLNAYATNPTQAKRDYGYGSVTVRGQVKAILGTMVTIAGDSPSPVITCFGLSNSDIRSIGTGSFVTIEGRITLGNAGGIHMDSCTLKR